MSVESENFPRAEEALRLLATAAGAARLYPPASTLPAEAVDRFTERTNEAMTTVGPMRYIIDPHGFRIGDAELAPGNSQVVTLAESLHALQVGQLVIVPGLTAEESTAFAAIANADVAKVRAIGGPRAALAAAGVTHIAVIEVSLRASEEEGLLGLDFMTAPLDEMAAETAAAAERWARSSGAGDDEMASAIGRLEAATRQLATERVAEALMRLDENTRMRVLGYSLKADTNGRRMDGMLAVIAQMKPAALARLLTLVAAQAGTDPRRIASALELPPETAKLLAMMLASASSAESTEEDTLVENPAAQLARDMAVEEDYSDLTRQIAIASPQLSAGRALSTAVSISREKPDADAVGAIGDSLAQAARDGAFPTVREALRRLDELASQPDLTDAIATARATLWEPKVLAEVCAAVMTDADAAIAGEILQAAGARGAEALLDAYTRGSAQSASLLRPVLRGMSEAVLGVARTRLRTENGPRSIAVLRALGALGDRRAVPVIALGLNHLDEPVRFAAITSLANTPLPEAEAALVRALGHSEPETQRFVVREIGRRRVASAVPALARALDDINVLQRTYEIKKAILGALEQIGTPEAQKVLRRMGDRKLVMSRKTRELRTQARRAVAELETSRTADEGETP